MSDFTEQPQPPLEMRCRNCGRALVYANLGGNSGDDVAWACYKCEIMYCGKCVAESALSTAQAVLAERPEPPSLSLRDQVLRTALSNPGCLRCDRKLELARESTVRAIRDEALPHPFRASLGGGLIGMIVGLIVFTGFLKLDVPIGAGVGLTAGIALAVFSEMKKRH